MLKIGFDFDGVIAYNPLRVFRLPLNLASRALFGKKIINYYPSNNVSQFFWKAAHKFSIFPARGFAELKKLLQEGQIEGYLITGRYVLLEDDLKQWLGKHKADKLFKGYYVNKANEPPHKFKEKMIQELQLDYFVEDNWDIVKYLNSSLGISGSRLKAQGSRKARLQPSSHVSIHWIYNILDRHIPYSNKHPHLKKFLETLQVGLASQGRFTGG